MPEFNTKLTGWQAIAAIVVLIGIVGVRLMTFSDKKGDAALMKVLERELMSDYYPDETARLKAAYEAGDKDALSEVAQSVTSTSVEIDSVRASYPLFKFSAKKEVVVKVTYTLKDATGPRKTTTVYYLFNHGSIGNIWQYKYESNAIHYYFNFL